MPHIKSSRLSFTKVLAVAAIVSLSAHCSSSSSYEDEDYAYMDKNTRPQDDFYQHLNGKWLDEFTIPADKSRYGAFVELRDKVDDDLHAIMADLLQDTTLSAKAQQIKDVYQSYLDTDTINALGIEPLKPWLELIANVKTHDQLAQVMGRLSWIGVSPPVDIAVYPDAKVYDAHAVYTGQAGLGMPDRDYYLKDEAKFLEFQNAYKQYIDDIMVLAGFDANSANTVYPMELSMAKEHWDRVRLRDPNATYNKMTITELERQYGQNFKWQTFLDEVGVGQATEIVVESPSYFEAFDKLLTQYSVEDWQTYLRFHLINRFASFLSSDYEDLKFAFYGKTLSGIEEQEPRTKRALQAVNNVVGESLGELYVAEHFPPEAKQALLHMLGFVKDSYREHIKSNTWMQDETKAKALEKLDAMGLKIGYPEVFKDYSSIETQADTLVQNFINGTIFHHQYAVQKLGEPVDRKEWHMLPHVVNAYYNPLENEIVFPAAILQPPFFDYNRTDAENYGAAAAVIGHEISHGFDDQGRQFDAKGQLNDWWTEQDSKAFEARTQQLITQYDEYEPIEGAYVNGKLTLGENIADLTGLYMAHYAYHLEHNSQPEVMPGPYSADQMLFMSWARVWRVKHREQALREQLISDPHAPGHFRCNGVLSNLAAFYQTYNVQEGDAMYIPESKRVKLWF